MRDRRDPWRWPFSIGLALSLFLAGIFLIPQTWVDFFLSSLDRPDFAGDIPPQSWLEILPPPELYIEQEAVKPPVPPDPPPLERPDAADARWWTQGWRVRVVETVAGDLHDSPIDSSLVLLTMLDLTPDILGIMRPDSVLASRLWFMQLADSFRFDELKPYLGAMTRSQAYADIMSRAADMYDDFLESEIMVPD